ncbi:unnamed protein product, partial [Meganyctiphanes norvegica]
LFSIALVFGVMALMVGGKEIIDLMGKWAFPTVAVTLLLFTFAILILLLLSHCGSKKDSPCILSMYVGLVFVTIIGLLAATFFAWLFRDVIVAAVRKEMEQTIQEYRENNSSDLSNAWDMLQQFLECCGIDTLGDWTIMNLAYKNVYGEKYPQSCKAQYDPIPTGRNFPDGCLLKVTEIINANHWPIGGVIAAITFYLMISAMIACALSRSIQRRSDEMHPNAIDPGLILNGMSTIMSTNSRTPITTYS